jgi:hypothetical protein
LLIGLQELPGCLEHLTETSVSLDHLPPRRLQEIEVSVELGEQVRQVEDPHPGRGEFERQRHAFQE